MNKIDALDALDGKMFFSLKSEDNVEYMKWSLANYPLPPIFTTSKKLPRKEMHL
mgnify:CR=1 FL=1